MNQPSKRSDRAADRDSEWSRRIGPEATRTRRTAVRTQRSARGVLIVYVAGLLIVFGSQGFRSTGERTLPNVVLFGSMILVLACEIVLTIRQQRSMSQARKQASAVLTRGTGETRNVLPSDEYLLQLSRFDQWTARYKLQWFDGTVPSSRSAQP